MTGLCLAIMAGTLLAALPFKAHIGVLFVFDRAVQVIRAPFAILRDRDPPCLFELSIQRC